MRDVADRREWEKGYTARVVLHDFNFAVLSGSRPAVTPIYPPYAVSYRLANETIL